MGSTGPHNFFTSYKNYDMTEYNFGPRTTKFTMPELSC